MSCKFITTLFLLITGFTFQLFGQNYPYSGEEDKLLGLSITASLKISNSITLSRGYESIDIIALPAFAAGIEYYIFDEENRKGGLGFEYGLENEAYGLAGTYRNVPLYLFYEFSVIRMKYLQLPFIHLQLGCNWLTVYEGFPERNYVISDMPVIESGPGLYYGFGFSVWITRNITARILYTSNLGKINLWEDWHFTNSKVNITAALVL